MRFTEQHKITRRTKRDDWFDPVVTEDTPLYVDPFLVFEDEDPFWRGVHDEVVDFFLLGLGYVQEANGDTKSAAWSKAERLLLFPEPKEFALGLSMGHPEGSGTGRDFAHRMTEALDVLRLGRVPKLGYVEAFILFCDGLGVDRISDVFCNIVKHRFIAYTQRVAKRHQIPTEDVHVRHRRWSQRSGRWEDGTVSLPASPAFKGGVLLTPKRFLKDIPRVTPEGFWSWTENYEAEALRADLNYDLSKSLTQGQRAARGREVARRRPDLALRYLDSVAEGDLRPYDVDGDERLLVGWNEVGRHAATQQMPPEQPASQEEFCAWVGSLMEKFRYAVEETDLWKALWNDDLTRHRQEKIVQAIASVMWAQHCEAAKVDLSREVNIGRGPVDFKFSAGWAQRALTEVKLIGSTQFFTGASRQLPQYLKSERVACGWYACVGFTNADFGKERLKRVRDTLASFSERSGKTVKPIFIDARPDKKSASKLKDTD